MSAPEPWYRRAFDDLYLQLYAERDREEAERATEHLLVPLALANKRVLDLGCGAGRYALAVASRGARVLGLDLSAPLVAAAQRSARGHAGVLGFVRGDMRQLPFPAHGFDLVLSMFTSFGYFPDADDDRAALREIGRVLRPGGALLLDLFNADKLRRTLVPETRRRVGRFHVRERRSLQGDSVRKDIELVAGRERHRYQESVRLWSRDALRGALAAAGLEPVREWGSYVAEPFDAARSDRLVMLARAVHERC